MPPPMVAIFQASDLLASAGEKLPARARSDRARRDRGKSPASSRARRQFGSPPVLYRRPPVPLMARPGPSRLSNRWTLSGCGISDSRSPGFGFSDGSMRAIADTPADIEMNQRIRAKRLDEPDLDRDAGGIAGTTSECSGRTPNTAFPAAALSRALARRIERRRRAVIREDRARRRAIRPGKNSSSASR